MSIEQKFSIYFSFLQIEICVILIDKASMVSATRPRVVESMVMDPNMLVLNMVRLIRKINKYKFLN